MANSGIISGLLNATLDGALLALIFALSFVVSESFLGDFTGFALCLATSETLVIVSLILIWYLWVWVVL